MRPLTAVRSCLVLVGCAAMLTGCGGSGRTPAGGAPAGIPTYNMADLPALSEPMVPLDDGRLLVRPPKGWHIPSRDARFICRFQLSATSSYPTIIVTGSDYEPVFNVTGENVVTFAQQVAAEFRQQGDAGALSAPVVPIKVGDLYAVAYERVGRAGRLYFERMIVETVMAGRRYAIETRALEGTLVDYRGHGLAVAGGLEFPKAAASRPPLDAPELPESPDAPETPPSPEPAPQTEPEPDDPLIPKFQES
jgi:hypothetical protein